MKNELKETKITLLDKIKWKIKYRELNSILGKDTSLARGILKNKIIEDEYNKNKEEIINTLKKIEEQIPDKANDVANIITQTLYNDYMRNALFSSDENSANILEVLHNLEFMLSLKKGGLSISEDLDLRNVMTDKEIEEYKKNLSAKKIIFNQLNVEDCKNKYFKQDVLPLFKYSEKTLKKYTIMILKKLSFISEEDFNLLNEMQINNIIKANNQNIDNSVIYNYIQICEKNRITFTFDSTKIVNFLGDNMEYSDFFAKYIEKYKGFPSSDTIHELFDQTRSMTDKSIMLNLHMDESYYSELRNKFIDFEIEEELSKGINYETKDHVKDLISKKYFNIKYSDIESIIESGKQEIFSENTQKIMKYVNKIQRINDIGELIRINKEIAKRDVNIDIGKTFDEIYEYYAREKLDGCFNPKEFTGEKQKILYKGKEVEILKLQGEDYRGNVHVLGARAPGAKNLTEDEIENKARYDNPLLFSMLEGYSSNLSLSTERDDAMAFFACDRSSLILGFSEIKPQNVLGYHGGDGATSTGQTNYNKSIAEVKEDINFNDRTRYDELLVSRYEDTSKLKEYRKNEKRVLPSYILVFKGDADRTHINYNNLDDVYTKRILEYAITYNIPIVEMDTEKYLEKYQGKYESAFEKMRLGKEKFEMKDFEALARYSRMKRFYDGYGINISDKDVFLEIIDSLNVTKENEKTIKQIIERFNYQGLQDYTYLTEELREKAMEKIKLLKERLQITKNEEITINNSDSQQSL